MFQRSASRRIAGVVAFTVATVAAMVGFTRPEVARAVEEPGAEPAAQVFADKWLVGLNGQARQLFDSPAPVGGIPLVHIMNFLDTYNSAYKISDAKLNTVGTFYGSTTFHGLNDAMWTKYDLAGFLKGIGVDAGAGKSANPWRTEPQILGMSLPQASIESLQKRGTRFIICNNALSIFAGMVAQGRGLDAQTVYADMKANILPDVELVPAMVIAIGQGQDAGLAYHRQ
jgi:intracellular sulfur oxidation DsrE/DsrF family protein